MNFKKKNAANAPAPNQAQQAARGRSLRSGALGVGSAGLGNGTWRVDELLVNAESSGQVGAFSIAGALARTAQEQEAQESIWKCGRNMV